MVGLKGQLAGQLVSNRDITKGQHRTDDYPFGVADGRHRILHRQSCAIWPLQKARRPFGTILTVASAPQTEAGGVGQSRTGSFVEKLIHLIKHQPLCGSLAPTDEALRTGVEIAHTPDPVGGDHTIADGCQGDLGEHLLRKQLLLDLPAFGDVSHHADKRVIRATTLAGRQLCGEQLTVFAVQHHFSFHLAAGLRQQRRVAA